MTALRRERRRLAVVTACLTAVVTAVSMLPGTAFGTDDVSPALGFQGETGSLQDVDRRGGPLPPTRAQRAAVRALGAHATWNRFGTPRSLIKFNGYLATGLGPDAVPAARRFITANRALFRLSKAGVKTWSSSAM